MRVIAGIFALFILGLSVAPCDDEEQKDACVEMCPDKTQERSQEHSEDLCSPLCICHCCHSHLIVEYLPVFTHSPVYLPEMNSEYLSSPGDGYNNPLLQPPQA